MKHIFRFIAITFLITLSIPARSQKLIDYKSFLSSYFETKKFENNPDSIFLHLVNDKDLRIDSLVLPSDSTLLYLRGYYKKFNPFTEEVKLVQVYYYQHLLPQAGSTGKDTSVAYRLYGITDTGTIGRRTALNLENKIYSRLKIILPETKTYPPNKRNKYFSTTHYYYIGTYPIAFTGVENWHFDDQYYCVVINIDLSFIKRADLLMEKLKAK